MSRSSSCSSAVCLKIECTYCFILKRWISSKDHKTKVVDKYTYCIFQTAVLKQLFDCTDGRVKLWVYAVTAVGFILILFIIALSFLVWYVPYCFLTRFLAVHFAIFKNKSSIVGDTYCRWEQTEHGEEAKQIPEMNLVKYEMYASQYFLCHVLLLSDNGVRCSYLLFFFSMPSKTTKTSSPPPQKPLTLAYDGDMDM